MNEDKRVKIGKLVKEVRENNQARSEVERGCFIGM